MTAELDATDLRAAVSAGVVSEAQAASLSALALSRRGARAQGDEPFELFRGLNDVFVALGVFLLGAGLSGLALILGIGPAAAAGLAGCWLLAEYLTRIRRMTLPSLLLALGFTLSATALATAMQVPGASLRAAPDPLVVFLAGAAAALVFHLRFRLPFALFLLALSLYGALIALLWPGEAEVAAQMLAGGGLGAVFDLGASSTFAIATLVFGLACFAAALAFDLRDPHRVSRLSACGFWLHLAAGPAIVNTVALSLLRQQGMGASLGLGLFLALIVAAALVIDRRSFLMAAAAYLGSIVWSATDAADLGVSGALLALGALVIALGAGWTALRASLLTVLPDFPGKDRLPPWTPRGARAVNTRIP